MLLALAVIQSCATYYDKTKQIEEAIVHNDFDRAKKKIRSNKFLKKKRNSLLFHLEMGKICHLNNEFDTSNFHFDLADDMMKEMNKMGDFAISTLTNPSLQKYRASDYEKIMVHYYKALNYLKLGKMEDAVVEARQLNLVEQALFIAKKGKKKKYSQDPFGLILMGMLYEADNDFNNAFIAYRNAMEYYETSKVFAGEMPMTLKADVARTAKLSGIYHKSDETQNRMETKGEGGELILFWENGLAPIKREKNLFFSLLRGKEKGVFIFANGDNSIAIPVNYDFDGGDEDFDPSDIGVLRIAHSFYESRQIFNHHATLTANGKRIVFSMGENIEKISFQIEKENAFKDLAQRLIRMVVKKIAELKLSEQNEYAGLALGIANLAMEKSDTRNWQTLPNQIQYARIPLEKGQNKINVTLDNGDLIALDVQGNGKMQFKNIVTN
jgi:hypothetical protein